jgi:predicted AlkP superfamily phosphohydrolase/phosphomutase
MAVNKWLQDQGLLKTKRQTAKMLSRVGLAIKRTGLEKPALRILRSLIGTRRYESVYYRSVVWPETKIIYGPGQGFYINMKDRDHEGVVSESEYEPLREHIIHAMKEMRDPETGLPVVGDVLRREELYEGMALDWAPDIVPTKAEYFSNGKRWGYGLTKFLHSSDLYFEHRELSGTHSPEGMFIARGPHTRNGYVESLHIKDIAPTALYVLGQAIPAAMDGKVRTELFTDTFVDAHPVITEDINIYQDGKSGQVLSEEHEAIVEKRLKDMGYL